jgi:hypothetical protein
METVSTFFRAFSDASHTSDIIVATGGVGRDMTRYNRNNIFGVKWVGMAAAEGSVKGVGKVR